MKERTQGILFGSAMTLIAGLLASAAAAPDDVPPHLGPDTSLWGLELSRSTVDILPGVGPATQVHVVGNQGKWFLLKTPNQPRGPQWVNFDQVISYRTKP